MIVVDVWADVRCPWCWIGLRRLGRATRTMREAVGVRHRSFLLEPNGPVNPGSTTVNVATKEWGLSSTEWEAKSRHIRAEGRRENLDINIDEALMFDSAPVHRLLKSTEATPNVDTAAAWDTAFNAHFNQNQDLGNLDVLSKLAGGWGLNETQIEAALESKLYATEVEDDAIQALRVPVRSVPTIVTTRGDQIPGTPSVDDLVTFLTRAGASQ